jgi:hypothetical protein
MLRASSHLATKSIATRRRDALSRPWDRRADSGSRHAPRPPGERSHVEARWRVHVRPTLRCRGAVLNPHVMNNSLQRLALAATLLVAGCAVGEEYEAPQLPPPPPPPPAPTVESAPSPEPYTQASPAAPSGSSTPPPASPPVATPSPPPPAGQQPQLVYAYPGGQWVYLAGQGWVWIPSGAAAQDLDGVPYVFLYTPAYGWTWYVSPWGGGLYHYGAWIHHPWHPVGMHGYWVARPGVVRRFGRRR